jgi:hypothetical protein
MLVRFFYRERLVGAFPCFRGTVTPMGGRGVLVPPFCRVGRDLSQAVKSWFVFWIMGPLKFENRKDARLSHSSVSVDIGKLVVASSLFCGSIEAAE